MSDFDGMDAVGNFRLLSAAASDNAASVYQGLCSLKVISCFNAKASNVFLKIYDKATTPSSSDTPVLTFCLQTAQMFQCYPDYDFQNGIGFRITGAVADADNTALLAGDVLALNLLYV